MTRWRVVAAVEVALAAAVVLLDLGLPTLVLLVLAGVSLALRRQGPASVGFARVTHPWRMVLQVAGLSAVWSLLVVGLVLPALEHLTGDRQDVSDFAELEGNVAMLAALLAASWTLAALGEELAFRGFLLTRLRELLPAGTAGPALAVLASSALFGLIHTEQGAVGVTLAAIDGVFHCILRLGYRTLWASVLAHGFVNTLGMTVFFVIGPVSGLW